MPESNLNKDSSCKNVETTNPEIGLLTKIKNLVLRRKEVFVYTTQKTSIYLEHQRTVCGERMEIRKLANPNEVYYGTIYDIYAPLEDGVSLVKFWDDTTNKIWPAVIVDTTVCKRNDLPWSCIFDYV